MLPQPGHSYPDDDTEESRKGLVFLHEGYL
jgi:hypothetical protein